MRMNNRRKLVIIVGCIIVLAIVAISLLARQYSDTQGCDSVDPTGCVAKVKIQNDTRTTYTVVQCSGDVPCQSGASSRTIKAGGEYVVNGTYSDIPQPWTVLQNNTIVGCLNLSYSTARQDYIVQSLSQLETCESVKQQIDAFKVKYHSN